MTSQDAARHDRESADDNGRRERLTSRDRPNRPPLSSPVLVNRSRSSESSPRILTLHRAAGLAIALACCALAHAFAGPAETNELRLLAAHHAPSLALLARNTIRVEGRGTIPVDFQAALRVLSQSNILDRVQEEYARSLPEGQQPEFVLHAVGSNTWSFVNRHGQHSEVCEVARVLSAPDALAAVLYAKGERFFGLFESLSVIRTTAAPEGRVGYTVQVFAYPHQPVCRFVIRRLGLVERFFKNKTKELEDVSSRICRRLCDPAVVADPDAAKAAALEFREAPANPLESNSHTPAIPF